jgi:hypothetical protein
MKRSRVALSLFLATFGTSLLTAGFSSDRCRVAAEPPVTKIVKTHGLDEFDHAYADCSDYLAERCPYAYDGLIGSGRIDITPAADESISGAEDSEDDYRTDDSSAGSYRYDDEAYSEYGYDDTTVQPYQSYDADYESYDYGNYGGLDDQRPTESYVGDDELNVAPQSETPSRDYDYDDYSAEEYGYDGYEYAPKAVIAGNEPCDASKVEPTKPTAAEAAAPVVGSTIVPFAPTEMGPCTRQRWAYSYDDGGDFWTSRYLNIATPGADSLVELLRDSRYNAGLRTADRINAENDGVKHDQIVSESLDDTWNDAAISDEAIAESTSIDAEEIVAEELEMIRGSSGDDYLAGDEFYELYQAPEFEVEIARPRQAIVVEYEPIPDATTVSDIWGDSTIVAGCAALEQIHREASSWLAGHAWSQLAETANDALQPALGWSPPWLSSLWQGYQEALMAVSQETTGAIGASESAGQPASAQKSPIDNPRTSRRDVEDAFEL